MNSKDRKLLADKLKELRLAHGYKQAVIAGAIDIKQATYSNYELGKRTPGSVTLYRIASFYGMSADDLLKLSIPWMTIYIIMLLLLLLIVNSNLYFFLYNASIMLSKYRLPTIGTFLYYSL